MCKLPIMATAAHALGPQHHFEAVRLCAILTVRKRLTRELIIAVLMG
jgi:hypothetical protein